VAARTASEARLIDQPHATASSDELHQVALACQGDQLAFERLYLVHVRRIHGLVRRMANVNDVDDITQDVFVRAWEKLGTFRGASSFGTWLHRLAVNVIVERHRRAFRRGARMSTDETALDRAAGQDRDAAFPIDFEAAVERLPLGARQVFVLHDVEGYQHREIGKLMGITAGTSKGQLHRARMILRRHLGSGASAAPDRPRRAAAGGSNV
jgi:RNA polymerase sigma-70 factor (ECF subfamily)